MEPLDALDVLARWIHIGVAIVILGGSVFNRFVLMPAAEQLPDEAHEALRENVVARWRMFFRAGIMMFIISGFFNYFRNMDQHKGDALYHALLGSKIILAFGVFFLLSALSGKSKALDGLRQQKKKWMTITIILAAVVVALAGAAKVLCKL